MKKTIFILIILLTLTACTSNPAVSNSADTEVTITENTEISEHDFGAMTALEKQSFTIEEMLKYAIEDEYLARQEYESIMKVYGEQRPFSNIIKAEERHIEMLFEIYETYGYSVPEDRALDYVVIPESLEIAMDIGVEAEINNIAMYEKFLENELPEDIEEVFIELRNGSENHLAAFEKGVRGNGNGNN